MKKSYIIIFVIVGCIIFGFSFVFVRGVLNENKKTNERMVEIQKYEDKFNEEIKKFNNSRATLKVLLEGVYTDYFNDKYDNVKLLLNQEEEAVKNVNTYVLKLDNYCGGRIYSNSLVNSFCLAYLVNYEEMVNVYVNDIGRINQLVKTYNQSNSGSLEEYSSLDFGEDIDYNRDGVFAGKEE